MDNEFWDCSCGKTKLKGKFCTKCGKKRELNGNKDEREIKLCLEGSKVSSDEVVKSNDKEERNQKDQYSEKRIIYGLWQNANKKVVLVFFAIFVILLVFLSLISGKEVPNDTSMQIGTVLPKEKVSSEINREALFSKSEQGINEFKIALNDKNEKAMAYATDVIWITTKVYKQGEDIFIEGSYYNGTNTSISFIPEMKMDIFFYAGGKEIGSIKNEVFDKIQIRNLGARKKKNIRYKIEGKGRMVGDFSTFLVMTKFK